MKIRITKTPLKKAQAGIQTSFQPNRFMKDPTAEEAPPEYFQQSLEPAKSWNEQVAASGIGPSFKQNDVDMQYQTDVKFAKDYDESLYRYHTDNPKAFGSKDYNKWYEKKYDLNKKKPTNPFNGAKALIGLGSNIVDFFENRRKDREFNTWMKTQQMSDNLFPPQEGSRGDYVTTGTSWGMFRPDQYVVNKGMYNPGFSGPRMQLGGGIIPETIESPIIGPVLNLSMDDSPLPGPVSRSSNTTSAPAPDMSVSVDDKAKEAVEYYVKQHNLDPHIAAGIVGNLVVESNLLPTAEEKANTAEGRGVAQWNKNNRWKSFLNWAEKNNRNPNDLYAQLDYVVMEPGESQKVLKALQKAETPAEAAFIFGKVYERPNDKLANWERRAGIAEKLLQKSQFEEGGEYELTEDEIRQILKYGGDVEFL